MKKYEKPILEEEKVQIEDICSVSVDIPGGSLPAPSPNAVRWGK